MKTRINPSYVEYIRKETWRFFIDGYLQDSSDPYIFDHPRAGMDGEPGYHASMMQAINMMLEDIDQEPSVDLVIKWHDIAVDHLSPAKNYKGLRNNHPMYYGLVIGNTSMLGLKELVQEGAPYIAITKHTLFERTLPKNLTLRESYRMLVSGKYERSDPSHFPKYYGLRKFLYAKLNSILHAYFNNLECAHTPFEKIKAIVTFIRNANLVHAFSDGNTRALVFLDGLSKFLRNGFPPPIFLNPGIFDGYGILELIIKTAEAMLEMLQLSNIKCDIDFEDIIKQARTELEKELTPDLIIHPRSQLQVLKGYSNAIFRFILISGVLTHLLEDSTFGKCLSLTAGCIFAIPAILNNDHCVDHLEEKSNQMKSEINRLFSRNKPHRQKIDEFKGDGNIRLKK